MPMIEGSTPAEAQLATRARIGAPRRSASSRLISTSAAAPSLRPEALAAVTVPSFLKAGRRPARPDCSTPSRIYSSVSTIVSPLRVLTVTAAISSLKRPAARAADGLVLRGGGEGVLVVAGDLILLGQILGGDAHVIAVEDVGEAVLDHRVDEARRRPSWCRRADSGRGWRGSYSPGRRRRRWSRRRSGSPGWRARRRAGPSRRPG